MEMHQIRYFPVIAETLNFHARRRERQRDSAGPHRTGQPSADHIAPSQLMRHRVIPHDPTPLMLLTDFIGIRLIEQDASLNPWLRPGGTPR
jgi:hypothetical protein